MIVKSKFSCATDKVFNGYSTLQTWNGWSCPLFTIGQARKVIKYFNAQNLEYKACQYELMYYDASLDVIIGKYYEEDELVSQYETSPIIIHGVKYYDINNYNWTWEEIRN